MYWVVGGCPGNKLFQDRHPDQFNDLDRRFPDAPNYSHTVARRPSRSITLRSTLSSAMVSEFRVGITVGETIFFGQTPTIGPSTFADQGGRALTLGSGGASTSRSSGCISMARARTNGGRWPARSFCCWPGRTD
jgi:hypothetical protein